MRQSTATRRGVRAGAAALGCLITSSCSAIGVNDLPPGPSTLEVTMKDYQFDFDRRVPHVGRIAFQVTNHGPLYHQLALVPLPEDMPPIKQQALGSLRSVIGIRAQTPPLSKGNTDVFAADLTPGRWGFVCFVTGPEGSHARKGMVTEFRVA